MGEIIKKLDSSWVRGLTAILVVIALVAGFFMGLIQPEFFQDIIILIVGFYFGKGVPTERQVELEKKFDQTTK